MLKKQKILKHPVGPPNENEKSFNDYRNFIIEELISEYSIFKRKMTQGAFWVALEKDLANQFFRDERWLCGIKFWDATKFIDHGFDKDKVSDNKKKVAGF